VIQQQHCVQTQLTGQSIASWVTRNFAQLGKTNLSCSELLRAWTEIVSVFTASEEKRICDWVL